MVKNTVTVEQLQHDKNITIIKRNGSEEKYNPKKMLRVIMWACEDVDWLATELQEATEFKQYNKMKITDLYDELVKTAVNKISMLYPQWEDVAAKLYMLKIYKDTWNVTDKFYPHLKDVLSKGSASGTYNKEIVSSFSDEEIEQLNAAINQEYDYKFTYKSLYTFFDKYCLKYSKTKKLELPQLAYMRVAMFLHSQDKSDRIFNIIKTYDNLASHKYTLATPIMLNAGTKFSQLSSCVLSKVNDSTKSIMDTMKNLAVYSKHKGGTALDISEWRSKGAYIAGTQGVSSGPVPFLKIVESTMKAFNQGGARPGANCVYFPWWHADFDDLIVLKSNGGTEENRCRGLKYAVKINNLLIERAVKNENIHLFDPMDVRPLIGKFGSEFERLYEEYENKPSLKKRSVNARDMFYKIMKERSETGNVYLFHEENVNENNMLDRYINSSNLCTEILEPSVPSSEIRDELMTGELGDKTITKQYNAGEIALCNLASVNLLEYSTLSDEEKETMIYNVMSTMDNTIDIAKYPVKEGMNANQQYRYLGSGVNNYANYLASKEIIIGTQEALEETSRLFDELSYNILSASNQLAIERGKFDKFYSTRWADGHLPIDSANKNALSLTKYQPDMKKWNVLREKIRQFGVRNALHMAIAPTATSGKAQNATESIEPIQNLFYKEDGTMSVPTIVPNFRKNNQFYKRGFDCDQMKLVELAAIRQMYLDQSQSVNLYFTRPDSFLELMNVHLHGFKLGVKTFYYLKQKKDSSEAECESCS